MIEADQPGDAQYYPADPVRQNVVVLKATGTITFGPLGTVPFGAGPLTLGAVGGGSSTPVAYTVLYGPGQVNGNQLTVTGLGTVLIEASQAGDSNYLPAIPVFQTLQVEKPQSIKFPQPTSPVAFGVKPITLSATAGSGLPVQFAVVSGPGSINGNKLTITGAGSVVIEADQAGNAVYAPAVPVQRTLVVGKASQTITFNAAHGHLRRWSDHSRRHRQLRPARCVQRLVRSRIDQRQPAERQRHRSDCHPGDAIG